jgi:hypothetical protein
MITKKQKTRMAIFTICLWTKMGFSDITELSPVSQERDICTLAAQAYLCDIAGVGVVVESQPTWFNIAVSNVWFGAATGNVMRIEVVDSSPPVTNAPIVFLAATNEFFKGGVIDPINSLCSWSFLTNRTVSYSVPNYFTNALCAWNLIGDKLSWFYMNEDNGESLGYVSNLVYKARVQKNHENVYEYLRTQANTNSAPSRKIWIDARFTFINLSRGGPNSFRRKIMDDPLMPIYIKQLAANYYDAEEPQ